MKKLLLLLLLFASSTAFAGHKSVTYDDSNGIVDLPTGGKLNWTRVLMQGIPGISGDTLSLPTLQQAGFTNEVWITVRTDGLSGSGTHADPFDGSGTKFDTLMQSYALAGAATVRFHLGPGAFTTNVATATGAAYYVQSGWDIRGAGMYVTTVQLTGNLTSRHYDFEAFKSHPDTPSDHVSISDLTVDCNYSGLTSDTGTGGQKFFKSGAVALAGSFITISKVRVIHSYGSALNNTEQFSILLSSPSGSDGTGNVIENCRVELPEGTYGSPYALVGQNPYYLRNSAVRDCQGFGLSDGSTNGFNTGGINGARLVDCQIERNLFVDCSSIYYQDTETAEGVTVEGNTLIRGWDGVAFVADNSGAWTKNKIVIVNNTIGLLNRVSGGGVYAINIRGGGTTNALVAYNRIKYDNSGAGLDQFYHLFFVGLTDSTASNNISDQGSGINESPTNLQLAGNRTWSGQALGSTPGVNRHPLSDATVVNRIDGLLAGSLRLQVTTSTLGTSAISYVLTANHTIADGDRLEYEVLSDSSNPCHAPYVSPNDNTDTDFIPLVDQNGLSYATDISEYAKDQWYYRQFDLSDYVGQTIAKVRVGLLPKLGDGSNNPVGTFRYYVRHIRVVDSTGATVQSYYTDETKLGPTFLSGVDYSAASITSNFGITGNADTGWTAWTGSGDKTTKAVSTATTADNAAAIKSLIDALTAKGLIGP